MPAIVPRADSLTGLRFFAAASIVLWHSQADYLFGPGAFKPFVLSGAVALFFVLSGYVLALNASKYSSWRSFWVARIARIWPAHVAAFVLLAAIFYPYSISLILSPDGKRDAVINLLLLQAWSPLVSVFWSYNSPSWSVSVELFFYATFPVLIILMRWRPWLGLLAVFAVSSAFLFGIDAAVPGLTPLWLGYINPIVNLPVFALGIAAGLLQLRLALPRVGVVSATCLQAGALVAAIWANASMHVIGLSPAASLWVSTAGACWSYAVLIFMLGRYDGVVSRVLARPVFIYLGEVSYALYLVHQPLLRWHSLHYQEFRLNIWLQYSLVLAAALGCAMVMHHVVERPCQRAIKQAWRRWRPVASAG